MSEPPEGTPPPGIQPQYSVPVPPSDRWLGRRAPYYGLGAGMAIYLIAYITTVILTFSEARSDRGLMALVSSIIGNSIATLLVLIAAIVLLIIRRTRAFGAGVAIAIALGMVCGGGVCTALVFGLSS